MGNVNAIALGPGTLKTAVLNSPEPGSLVAAWDAAWVDLGYSFEGHTFSWETTVEEVEVAEELLPVAYVPVKAVGKVTFTLAEVTATNLQRSLNGGTIVTASGYVTFEPPDLGQEVRRMYGWESSDGEERMVWRQCLNSGAVEINRRKGSEKAGIPFELNLEKPAGVKPFKYWAATPDRA